MFLASGHHTPQDRSCGVSQGVSIMCTCENAVTLKGEDYTCLHCPDCGTDSDYMVTHNRAARELAITRHQKTMARIRDIVAHTCDGPLTTFVHVVRVLNMVEAFDITAEEGANYLHENGLLNNENAEIPSSEY